uniref:Uncharacterized protein n=1 Tax=Rhizophora mucronata TaxID=61149 RepID=A0A2P2PPU9_RHIMU
MTMSNLIPAQNTRVDGATIGEASNLKTTELEHVNSTDSDNSLSDANSESFGKIEAVDKIGGESSNSSSSSVSDASDKINKPEGEAESDINSGSSSIIKEVTDDTLKENSSTDNESSGTDGNLKSSAADGTGAADTHDQIDPPNTSIGQDIDARLDLDTLPRDIVEGVNSRDAAAE